MQKHVLLAGSTGYIGSRVLRELLDHGYRVIAPVRSLPTDTHDPGHAEALQQNAAQQSEATLAEPTYIVMEHLTKKSLQKAIGDTEVGAVVSCIASRRGGIKDSEVVDYGINHEILEWAVSAGVAHFTLLSAICVQKPRLAFQHAKLRFEQELEASGLKYSIVRPTAFFKSLSGQLNRVQKGKPFLVFGSGELTRCKPISEADLARFIRLTLEDDSMKGVLPIGGPGPEITPLEQGQMLAEAAGVPFRSRSAPPGLLNAIAKLLSLGGILVPALAERAEFARIGYYYATESMLLWDEAKNAYDADGTPSFGKETLRQSYVDQIAGVSDQSLGAQAVFK